MYVQAEREPRNWTVDQRESPGTVRPTRAKVQELYGQSERVQELYAQSERVQELYGQSERVQDLSRSCTTNQREVNKNECQ